MTQLEILEYPDPRLRQNAKPVTEFDDRLKQFVNDLFETLYAANAIGLSATQVDNQHRILAIDLSDNASAPQVYINPEILSRSAWGLVEESCLSVPGVVGNVIRATEVRVRAQNCEGEAFERDLTGMHAVCLQHEMDHLEGTLFIDRLSLFRRLLLRISGATALRNRNVRQKVSG